MADEVMFSAPHTTIITFAPPADAPPVPITCGPYKLTTRQLNGWMRRNRETLILQARANAKRLTGREKF